MSIIISLNIFSPIILGMMGVLMIVLRAGASQVFFDVVGRFQAKRLISDAQTQMTVFNALMLDSLGNVQEAGQAMGDVMDQYLASILPSTIAIADATIELQKFVSVGEDFEALKEEVMGIGASFGYTGDQALLAASKMAQLSSVLGEGQTAGGAQLGFEFGLISGMETDKAMQRLVNLNQQMHFMTENTTALMTAEEKGLHIRQNTLRVLDQLNTIENRSAATMDQVTFVMNQFASQAHLTGESMAFMAAQSAVLIEAGEEQGKGGRALKAIYARLGADTSGAATALQELGVATHDSNGALLPLSTILKGINEQWDGMSAGQQQNLTQLIAGNRHYTRLIKLIEGYDRMLQLQLEGELALMPAIEEVNIRLDSNINKYREAEAELSNYQARLGDSLLPALTTVIEKQGHFNEALAEVAEFSKVGTLVVFGLGQAFQQIGGPLFNTFLMFQSLNVASNTLASVTRALQGEEIILATAYGNGGAAIVAYTTMLQQLNMVRGNEIKSVIQQYGSIKQIDAAKLVSNRKEIASELTKQVLAKKSLVTIKREISSLDTLIKRQQISTGEKQRALRSTTNINAERYKSGMTIDKLREKILQLTIDEKAHNAILQQSIATTKIAGDQNAKYLIGLSQQDQLEKEMAGNKLAKQSQAMHGLAGATTAAGGAIMMMAQNQKQMQLGMAISTIGILKLTAGQILNAVSTVSGIGAFKAAERAIGDYIISVGASTIQMGLHTDASNKFMLTQITHTTGMLNSVRVTNMKTASIQSATIANKAFLSGTIKLISRLSIFIAVISAAIYIYKRFNKVSKELEESQKQYKNGVLDSVRVMDKMKDTSYKIEDAEKAIVEQKKIIDDLMNRQDELAKSQRQIALDILATETSILNVKEKQLLVGINASEDENINNILKRYNTLLDFRKKMGADKTGREKTTLNAEILANRTIQDFSTLFGDTRGERMEKLTNSLYELGNISPAYDSLIKSLMDGELGDNVDIKSIEAFISSFTNTVNTGDGGASSVADTWEDATNAIQKFSNTREELFYGMNANNLTGDLIKQVQQTGVENLIANTEVIMTNNFNGMTTREVANEILEQISQGAGGIGVNIELKTI